MNRKLLSCLALLAAGALVDAPASSQTNGPPPRPTIGQAWGLLAQNLHGLGTARAWLSVTQGERRSAYLLYADGDGDVTLDSVGRGATRVHLHAGALTWSGGGAKDVMDLAPVAPLVQRLVAQARSGFSASQVTWQPPPAPPAVGVGSRWAQVTLPPPDGAIGLWIAFDDFGKPTAATLAMPALAATLTIDAWDFGAQLPSDVFQPRRPDAILSDPLNRWWTSRDVAATCSPSGGNR